MTAFRITGYPISPASFWKRSTVWSVPWYPGVTGTPAAIMISLLALFDPMSYIACAGGPMNSIPLSLQGESVCDRVCVIEYI